MRYMGGKSRQAKRIVDLLVDLAEGRTTYVEPFLGGGAVAAEACQHFEKCYLSDAVDELTCFWSLARDGWRPPARTSRESYELVRDQQIVWPTQEQKALKAWCGYALSFNGKWFGGYSLESGRGEDYEGESFRAVDKKARGMKGAHIFRSDYRELDDLVDDNCVVYCDPPYENTAGYDAAGAFFDHDEFWSYMDRWTDRGALVVVTEFTIPDGWESIYDFNRKTTVHHSGSKSEIERVLVRSSSVKSGELTLPY